MKPEKMYVRAEMEVVRLTESVITTSGDDNTANDNATGLAMTKEELLAYVNEPMQNALQTENDPDEIAMLNAGIASNTQDVNDFWGSTDLSGMTRNEIIQAMDEYFLAHSPVTE